MLKLKYAVLAMILSGCATTHVLSAGERTVVIQAPSDDDASAIKLAETECNKRGFHAQLSIKASPVKYVFDCVE